MSLGAKFSLTPLEPRKYLWDSANARYEYYATLSNHGVSIGYSGYYTLESYNYRNQVYLDCNNVGYPFPDPLPSDYYERAVAYLYFYTDAPTDKQHLVLFHVNCSGKIGIYLNGNLVREEDCNGDETIAVLVDCPGPGVVDRMCAAPQYSAWIKGVDCYVI